MWPGSAGEPVPVEATTTMSGVSHRSISPSALSSVRFATSGVTMLLVSPLGPIHIHWISGSKLSGGATSLQIGTPLPSSWTLHWSIAGASGWSPPSPGPSWRLPGPHATSTTATAASFLMGLVRGQGRARVKRRIVAPRRPSRPC